MERKGMVSKGRVNSRTDRKNGVMKMFKKEI